MPLTWDVCNIKDFGVITVNPRNNDRWHPVTHTLVMLSMVCGYDKITPKNIDKVWSRLKTLQLVQGAYLHSNKTPVYITKQDVIDHMGLQINSSTRTDSKFAATIMSLLDDRSVNNPNGKSAQDMFAAPKVVEEWPEGWSQVTA